MGQESKKDEKRITQYLLGQMAEEEQAQFEERYLADPDLRQELQAAERDLIDQYVRGELTNREQFEKYFLISPRRREKVEFARALMQSLSPVPVAAGRPFQFFNFSHRVWVPVAASFILIVGGWLLVVSRQGESPVGQAQQQQIPPGSPEPQPPSAINPPQPAQPSPLARAAVLVLTPHLTRNADETPKLILEGNPQVSLQLQLDTVDYKNYQVTIRTAEGDEIARQDQSAPQPANSGHAIIVEIPANRLNAGDYTVKVTTKNTDGEVEDVSSYYFRVEQK